MSMKIRTTVVLITALVSGLPTISLAQDVSLAIVGGRQIDADGRTVMPGLIDLHVHFDIIGHGNCDHWFKTYESRVRSDVLPSAARIILNAGVTSVRDLGTDIENAFWLREQIDTTMQRRAKFIFS